MSVMLVPVRYIPNRGGIETLLAHTLPILGDLGHEFVVVTGTDGGDESVPVVTEVMDGIPVYRFPFLAALRAGRPLPMLSIGRDLAAIEREHDVRIRHVHGLDFNLWWVLRRHRQNPLPFVMTVHGTLEAPYPYSPLTVGALCDADLVTAVSEGVRSSLVATIPPLHGRVRVIPNGISVRRPDTATVWPADGPLFVAGRLDHQKGFDLAVRAVGLLAARRPGLRLRIAGSGAEGPRLATLVRELGLGDRVDLLGGLAPAQVHEEIARASVVLVPSRSIEGFSLVALEAAQLGRPVVATRVGGLPETVVHGVTGLVVEPDDARALAAAVQSLLSDPTRSRRMAAEARARAGRFDASTCARAYSDVYRELDRRSARVATSRPG